jgi:hypothetical protein
MKPWRIAAMLLAAAFAFDTERLSAAPQSPRELSPDERHRLVEYLNRHRRPPEDYIVDKFRDHDLVILGEWHRIRHDPLLVQRLIPKLYEVGVRFLGFELGCEEFQPQLDRLLTADSYAEDLVRWMMLRHDVTWGYREYLDIYRAAWEFNRSLASGAPPFRIVHLDYRREYELVQPEMSAETWRQVYHKGERNAHMASVVRREFVEPGHKALLYVGMAHAHVGYRRPLYDHTMGWVYGYAADTMATRVARAAASPPFVVCLHHPWDSRSERHGFEYPVDGAIDSVMAEFAEPRSGFDVESSPFGELGDTRSVVSAGDGGFRLADYCDGYVFSKRLADYEGCTVDPAFITRNNLDEAKRLLPRPEMKRRRELRRLTPRHFQQIMEREGSWIRRIVESGLR